MDGCKGGAIYYPLSAFDSLARSRHCSIAGNAHRCVYTTQPSTTLSSNASTLSFHIPLQLYISRWTPSHFTQLSPPRTFTPLSACLSLFATSNPLPTDATTWTAVDELLEEHFLTPDPILTSALAACTSAHLPAHLPFLLLFHWFITPYNPTGCPVSPVQLRHGMRGRGAGVTLREERGCDCL